MRLAPNPSEVWIELHYRYRGELFQFNLPLHRGEKFLDGLRIDYKNDDSDACRRYQVVLEPLGSVDLESLELTGVLPFGDDVRYVFVNGYQSWTGSRERSPGERISALNWPGRLLSMQRFGDALFYPYSEKKGRFHGYSYAYIRYPEGLMFVGSLDEKAGYTVIGLETARGLFSIKKDVCGLHLTERRLMLDLVLIEGSETDVFDRYAEMRNDGAVPGSRATAWSTGRRNRGAINEVRVRGALASHRCENIPLTYFIVDDGWQSSMGDWNLPASGFPSGMSSLSAEIRGSGYVPGLWYAPFVVGVESSIFRTRKDWLARDRHRRIRPAGRHSGHGGLYFALDLSRQDVRDHIAASIARFRDEWGFGFLRLDLLYAAALYPPTGMSRGEAMNRAVDFLVSLKGSAVFEFSGVPLESAFGKSEYCRIGADTTPYWEHLFKRNIHGRERASTLNALRSTVGRRHLDGRFYSNSTDCFYLGSSGNSMEAPRRYTQMLLHYLLGSFICSSDDITRYDDDEKKAYLSLFPLAVPEIEEVSESRRTVTVRYRIGKRQYLSISNLAERIRPCPLPAGYWFGASGLKRRAHHVAGGGKQILKPGESRNYFSIPRDGGDSYAGSDGHIIPGSEIGSITGIDGSWRVIPAEGVIRDFRIWIRTNGEQTVRINDEVAEVSVTPFGVHLASAVVHYRKQP